MNDINEIYDEVKKMYLLSNVYGIGAWVHIELVYQIAIEICSEYGANYDIVALDALLHNVAFITDKFYTEEHHIIGAQIAEELLDPYRRDKEDIELIKNVF